MRGAGRAGRGERGRVAARVRRLLAATNAATDAGKNGDGPGDAPSTEDAGGFGPLRWQPDEPVLPVVDGEPDLAVAERDPEEPVDRWGHGSAGRPRRWRLDPGRRAAVAIGICALVAALVSGWWVWSARPRSLALAGSAPAGAPLGSATPLGSSSAVISPCATGSGSAATDVVVDVSGKVHRPGVYTLRTGARVVDAVSAAGGALPGISLAGLNLAARLSDGQQIAVGVPAAAPAGPVASGTAATGPGSTGTGGGTVNLNSAGLEQLQALPGVGPVTAQRIVDWRTQHGQFTSVDQLRDVSGIGDVRFAELKPLVSV